MSALTDLGGIVCDIAPDDEVDLVTRLAATSAIFDQSALPTAARQRRPVERKAFRRNKRDPLWEAFEMRKRAFDQEISVTREKLVSFLDTRMESRISLRGAEIDISNPEDFAVFTTLHLLRQWPQLMPRGYAIAPLQEEVENDWLRFKDYIVTRKAA